MTKKLGAFLIRFLSIFLILLGMSWSQLNQPAHWDETAYIDGVRTIFNANGFPFVEFWSYKPPLHFELGALTWLVFGIGRWQLRLVTLIELSLLAGIFLEIVRAVFTTLISHSGVTPRFWRLTSWLLVLLLLSNPVVFSQAWLYQPEIVLVLLWLLSLWWYLKKQRSWYWLAASLMVLTKESGVLYVLAIIVYDLLRLCIEKKPWRYILSTLSFTASPILWFVAWLFGNKYLLGWWLWPHNLSFFGADKPYAAPLITKIQAIFIDNTAWILCVYLLITIVLVIHQIKTKKLGNIFSMRYASIHLLVIGMLWQLMFVGVGAFIPRYVLGVYPALVIGIAIGYCCSAWYGKWAEYVAIVGLVFMVIIQGSHLFLSRHQGFFTGWALDHDLRYMRTSQVYQDLFQWWQSSHPSHMLIGDWLAWTYFIDPIYGYTLNEAMVKKFVNCDQVALVSQPYLLATGIGLTPNENAEIIACAKARNLMVVAEFGPIVVYTATVDE